MGVGERGEKGGLPPIVCHKISTDLCNNYIYSDTSINITVNNTELIYLPVKSLKLQSQTHYTLLTYKNWTICNTVAIKI